MPYIAKTADNPYQLSFKQRLVIADIVSAIKSGHGFNAVDSHMKIYHPKTRATASVMANENLNRPNFKQALLETLEYGGVLGDAGKLLNRVTEGLDAYKVGDNGEKIPDFRVRLSYIQEIYRIAGVY